MKRSFSSVRLVRKQRGLTLTETLVVMVVLSVVIGAAVSIGRNVLNQSRANAEAQAVSMIVMRAKSYYGGTFGCQGLDNSVAIAAGLVPDVMVSGNNLVNRWQGGVTISCGSLGPATNNAVVVTLRGINKQGCNDLVSRTDRDVGQIRVRGSSSGSWVTVKSTSDSMASRSGGNSLASACSGDTTNEIEWSEIIL